MKNKYFNELIKEVESFEKFWHKKYFQVNCRGKRIYKNFNDYYQKVQDTKKEETEKNNHRRISLSDPVAWSGSSVYMEK